MYKISYSFIHIHSFILKHYLPVFNIFLVTPKTNCKFKFKNIVMLYMAYSDYDGISERGKEKIDVICALTDQFLALLTNNINCNKIKMINNSVSRRCNKLVQL